MNLLAVLRPPIWSVSFGKQQANASANVNDKYINSQAHPA